MLKLGVLLFTDVGVDAEVLNLHWLVVPASFTFCLWTMGMLMTLPL